MPFERNFTSLQNVFSQLFDDSFWRPFESPFFDSRSFFGRSLQGWLLKVNVSETDNEIRISANIPGVDPEKVNIEIDNHSLILSGSTEEEKEEKGESFYRLERETGEFRRSFELPASADTENIKATVKHGILRITIPKKPEAQKKKVEVSVTQ